MGIIGWQGRRVELLKAFKWNGHNIKIFQEIKDDKYGQVLNGKLSVKKESVIIV